MLNHERFEELCALAAAGEISSADRLELMAHLEDCAGCRKTLADLKEIHATLLPGRTGFDIKRTAEAESKLEEAILRRATAEGARFSQPSFTVRRALAVAAAIILALLGIWTLNRYTQQPPPVVAQMKIAPPPGAAELQAMRDSIAQAEASRIKLEALLTESQAGRQRLERQLDQAQSDAKRVQQQLEEALNRTSILQESGSESAKQIAALQTQLQAVRDSYAKAADQLAAMKATASRKEVDLAVADLENKNLRDKLTTQTASLDREQDLLANGREIRDLIAARNLHIIDVYDTGGDGRTQKSFGRVFYTEGKSLVFYAYDLPPKRPAVRTAFYAWGKKDTSGEAKVRNLGIFYNDDQNQKRWVLTVTDPQVLSQIDSVFVTLEQTDRFGNAPTGKKLLSAYLGSPANHP
jgi:hypothetical protein